MIPAQASITLELTVDQNCPIQFLEQVELSVPAKALYICSFIERPRFTNAEQIEKF